MKFIVKDNERAFLFKDERFERMLGPGAHKLFPVGRYTHKTAIAYGEVLVPSTTDLSILLSDSVFASECHVVDVAEGEVCVRVVDGRYADLVPKGRKAFWNVFEKTAFVRRPTGDSPFLPDDITPEELAFLCVKGAARQVKVMEWENGVVFVDGRLERVLPGGAYYLWNGTGRAVDYVAVDLRIQQMEVGGQEVMSADKVALRFNLTLHYKVVDPVAYAVRNKDAGAQIHVITQMMLRDAAGKRSLDELLAKRGELGDGALEFLAPAAARLGVEFIWAGIKDIILPGEIRDIMNQVIAAEKRAQANLVMRREETASTRNLLNTAKLLDENKTLMRLKELEYLERICEKVSTINLSGSQGVLDQLSALIGAKKE